MTPEGRIAADAGARLNVLAHHGGHDMGVAFDAVDGESALDRGPCLLTQIAVAPTRPGL